ncbi:flagellar basal body rod protein FlgB [Jeotgalibacillus proteolyticus]|uniref:Flagellar basal body rod protein FlgB n=1 Tax=Jeotgalibacillus proteolyticus TaxID=2082395 RepID=A0A2S5GHL9_9BACL|nr:flagellar basal body rod protein FlgB [Jeotgalibacillus proteolyticus]PPA72479.1 flagellar basal body rod protein FlgB [Jeotgalibacillus proteolyticus]
MNLFTGTISKIESGLAYSSVKQKVIANNIANADTPGYKSKEVSFKGILQNEMKLQSSNGSGKNPSPFGMNTDPGEPRIAERNYSIRQNGNGVDMDREMANMATNQIYYDALIERISGKFSTLNTVIKGGK